MIAISLALRNVTRRLGTLAFVVLPAMSLFSMLTFLLASEQTVRRLTAPGIHQRAFRTGMIDGLSWDGSSFTEADVNKMATVPGAHMAPASFAGCNVDPTKPEDLKCGSTERTYVRIWEMSVYFSEAELDAWDKVPNGALVTRTAADRHGWKVGDHITLNYNKPLPGTNGPLELVITAITSQFIDPAMVYFHKSYFDNRYHLTASYWVVWTLVDDPAQRQTVMDAMEAKLEEMHHPHTMWPMEMSEQAILSGSQVLRESFRVAGAASLFVIVCVSVTLLIISIERRRAEFAALLAIGFQRTTLAASILLEGVLLVMPAACLGAIVVWIPFHAHPLIFDPIFHIRIELGHVLATTTIGLLLGLGAASIPALRVYRFDVLGALR